jgi:TPR repeat protein
MRTTVRRFLRSVLFVPDGLELAKEHLLAGDVRAAARQYRRAVKWGDPDDVAVAYFNLATIFIEFGRLGIDSRQAPSYLRRAAESGTGSIEAPAWLNRGVLLEKRTRVRSAEIVYLRGIGCHAPTYSDLCRNNLGVLHAVAGRTKQARAAWRRVRRAGDRRAGELAAFNLGTHFALSGDSRAAREAYASVTDAGDPVVSLAARTNLTRLDEQRTGTPADLVEVAFPLALAGPYGHSPYLRGTAGFLHREVEFLAGDPPTAAVQDGRLTVVRR